MHELSIAVGIVDAVAAEAEQRGFHGISAVYVQVGPLSGVDRDALSFSFPIASEGTPLEGAQLVIEDVPVAVACNHCGAETESASVQDLRCSSCGSADTRAVRGGELELRAFEVAEEVHT